jgi:uncharacterized protein YrrD
MRRHSDIKGTRVITLDTAADIGEAKDLVFDVENNQLLAIVLDEAGLTHSARIIPFSNVKAVGRDAVIVDTQTSIIAAERDERINHVLKQEITLKNKKVYTMEGEDLGKIVDIRFDEQTGRIEGYDVSGGIFADAYSGRPFIPAPKTVKVGHDVVLVPGEVAHMMEEQVGGVKAAGQRLGEKAQGLGQSVSDKGRQWGQTASEKAAGWKESTRAKATAIAARKSVFAAEGKVSRGDLFASDGSAIVTRGQLVDRTAIEKAREENKEEHLLNMVGIDSGELAKTTAANGWESGKARGREMGTRAKGQVSRWYQGARGTFAGWRDRAADRMKEEKIKRALGRPTTRVILDNNDEVILNTGDIITHEAIEEARRAGILDALLASVHVEDNLTKEELKAPSEGRASLKKE